MLWIVLGLALVVAVVPAFAPTEKDEWWWNRFLFTHVWSVGALLTFMGLLLVLVSANYAVTPDPAVQNVPGLLVMGVLSLALGSALLIWTLRYRHRYRRGELDPERKLRRHLRRSEMLLYVFGFFILGMSVLLFVITGGAVGEILAAASPSPLNAVEVARELQDDSLVLASVFVSAVVLAVLGLFLVVVGPRQASAVRDAVVAALEGRPNRIWQVTLGGMHVGGYRWGSGYRIVLDVRVHLDGPKGVEHRVGPLDPSTAEAMFVLLCRSTPGALHKRDIPV